MVLTPEILRILEFDKLREFISSYSFSALGKNAINAIVPICEKKNRDRQISLISEFRELLNSTHTFPTPEKCDIRNEILRTDEGVYHLSREKLILLGRVTRDYRKIGYFLSGLSKEFQGLSKLCVSLKKLPNLYERVQSVFDENGEIKDNASQELKKIRKDFRKAHKVLTKTASNLVSEKKKYLQEEIFTTREQRIVLPVRASAKSNINGIVHGISQSQNSVFIEPVELIDLNNECSTYKLREENEIKRILGLLSQVISDNIDCYKKSIEEITEIDKIYGISSFANEYGFSVPQFSTEHFIRIRQGKHPLLAVKKERENVVPFDVELGRDSQILLVSGPNMGGKTVLIKSVGIIVLMAYSGLHIPADNESVIPEIDAIYLDIGDEQSIEMDLSTFSFHIKNIISAVNGATQNSLILLDEIGVGTDPEEGLVIAMAVLEKLKDIGGLTFATTHYGKLKHFAAGFKQMLNASMDFDTEKGKPTYSLLPGIPGSSHGFAIAEKMGFPAELLEKAKSYIDKNELKTDELICSLAKLKNKLRKEKDDISKYRRELKVLLEEYSLKNSEIEERRKELLIGAKERALNIVYDTRKEMEHIIEKIRESQASKEEIKKAKKAINTKIEQYENMKKSTSNKTISPGDYVFSTKLKIGGTVVDIMGDYAKVDAKSLRFIAPFETLELRKEVDVGGDSGGEIPSRDADFEVDIRGFRAEEARCRVIRFIDDAVISGLSTVYIIHGKGTGVLRTMIDALLKEDTRVQNYRLGYWNEGGSGVTVVGLKA